MLPIVPIAFMIAVQAPQATVSGVIRDARTHAPVVGATVTLADVGRSASTDADGRYRFVDVPSGPQHLGIDRIGYAKRTLHALVPGAGQLRLDASLEPLPVPLGTIEVRGAVRVAAGTNDRTRADRAASLAAMRSHPLYDEPDALAVLAGGATTLEPELPSGLHVRGGAADQTAYVLDGIPVLNPYHAAGVFGAWNPSALSDVSLISTTPAPELSAALSGTVFARTRTPGPHLSGSFGISTTQMGLTMDGPIARAGYLLSARRTFAGSALRPREDSYVAGHGGDWLARFRIPVAGGDLNLIGFGNDNEFDAAAQRADSVPAVSGRNEFEWYARSMGAEWQRHGEHGITRIRAWHATTSAAALWNQTANAWDELDSSHSNAGALLSWESRRTTATTSIGARWTRLDAAYSVTGASTFERDGKVDVIAAFAQRRGSLAALRYDVAADVSHSLDAIRFAPHVQLIYSVTPSISAGTSLSRTHQFAQSLRNPESVIGTIFPADLTVTAGADVPAASSDQVVAWLNVTPASGVRLGAEGWARRLRGLALVGSDESEPFITRAVAPGRGSATGLMLEVSLQHPRHAVLASYAWQNVRYRDAAASFTPAHATDHRVDAGWVFFATPTLSFRAGVTGILGRTATPVVGTLEWESCNLLDRGCELVGSPDAASGARGRDRLPNYVRFDMGARKHWHVTLAGTDTQVGLFATITNVLGRRNVFRYVIDPATGHRSLLGMRPASPLTLGLDWRF